MSLPILFRCVTHERIITLRIVAVLCQRNVLADQAFCRIIRKIRQAKSQFRSSRKVRVGQFTPDIGRFDFGILDENQVGIVAGLNTPLALRQTEKFGGIE